MIDADDLFNMVCTEAHDGPMPSCIDHATPEEVHTQHINEGAERRPMESKTPRFDEYLRRNPNHAISAIARFELDGDIAALEARHAEELRRSEDSYQEALIKLKNRNAAVLEEIARSKRAAYEEAANEIENTTFGGQSREHLDGAMGAVEKICRLLREKAGKL